MQTHLFPALILLTLAPLAARAEEPPPAQADEATATIAATLPYGTGYEARQRLAQGGQQAVQDDPQAARDQERSQQAEMERAQERDRSEARSAATEARAARRDTQRSSTQRESRRDAREQRGQRGSTRH